MQALCKINPKQPRRCQLRENQLETDPQVYNKNLICIKLFFMKAYIETYIGCLSSANPSSGPK